MPSEWWRNGIWQSRKRAGLPALELGSENFPKTGLQSTARHAVFPARSQGHFSARGAELVDALDSGSSRGNPVQVRVLSRAPFLFSMG